MKVRVSRRVKTAAFENRCAISFCTEITFTFFQYGHSWGER
jgi:hypothetical protein